MSSRRTPGCRLSHEKIAFTGLELPLQDLSAFAGLGLPLQDLTSSQTETKVDLLCDVERTRGEKTRGGEVGTHPSSIANQMVGPHIQPLPKNYFPSS